MISLILHVIGFGNETWYYRKLYFIGENGSSEGTRNLLKAMSLSGRTWFEAQVYLVGRCYNCKLLCHVFIFSEEKSTVLFNCSWPKHRLDLHSVRTYIDVHIYIFTH